MLRSRQVARDMGKLQLAIYLMMRRFSHWLILFLLVVCPLARAAEPASIDVQRVAQPPKLEEYLNNNSHRPGVGIHEFRQREPGDGVPASNETSAYLSYDDKNLYVAFVCKDEPDKVRARMAKREDITSDDQVVVYLDTFHDRQRAYLFASNPLGIQLDGIVTEGQDEDFSFDTLWYSEGRVTSDGYLVMFSIPFKSLRFNKASAQHWGIALGRLTRRNNEESYWPYITTRLEGFVPQFATLTGLEEISPGQNLQFIPYGLFARARFLDTEQPAFRTQTDWRPGLDTKYVLRNAFTLDVTLNPDFSQVESDEPQVTVNQRFEVFFPEKRPFFIENAGFFQTPINLFFSRRVAEPQFGARLTGKAGRWALGALAIDDRAPGKRVEVDSPFFKRRAGTGALRVQREFGEQSSVGMMWTRRDFSSAESSTISVDARLKLSPTWVLAAQAVRNWDTDVEGTRASGPAYLVELNRDGRHFDYKGRYVDFSPDFRAPLGFVKRVDIRQMEHEADYRWRPKGERLLKFGPAVTGLMNWDRSGRLQDWVLGVEWEMEFTGQTELKVAREESFEFFEGQSFRKELTKVSFNTQLLRWLTIDVQLARGTDVNFDPAEGLAPFLGRALEGEFRLTFRPVPRFLVDQTYLYSRLRAGEESKLPAASQASVFTNHVLRTKVNYQFTKQLSLRAILDFESVLPNQTLADLEREKRFNTDLLLTYLVNTWTALYVGYTDGYENLALDPGMPPSLRRTRNPTTSTGRQFFVKVSYLWRF